MTIKRLDKDALARFLEEPEFSMGVQLGKIDGDLHFILSCEIAVPIGDNGAKDLADAISKILSEPPKTDDSLYPSDDTRNPFGESLLAWSNGLKDASPDPWAAQSFDKLTAAQITSVIGFVMPTAPYVPSPPKPPAHIYGHLPFKGTTTSQDAFLRFEPWPTSRRLTPTSVAPGTYAGPISERHLVPNGFAAVGRYALPNLLPACTVWKITPGGTLKAPTPLAVGASVPLYGQAGGGAEVCFTAGDPSATVTLEPALPVI